MYQPYLRICVLPGDTWTCIEPDTHPSTDSKPLSTPELITEINPAYHEFSPSLLNSHGYLNLAHFLPIIRNPLIELQNLNERDDDATGQVPQKLPNGINSIDRNKIDKFNGLSQVIFYQNPEPTSSTLSTSILSTPAIIDASTNEFFVKFISNFIFNKTVNTKSNKKVMKNRSTTTERIDTDGDESEATETTENPLDDDLDEAKTVIAIKGNLGTREYVTLEKYKLLSSKLKIEVLEIVPCTTGIRLPNATDCMRYYRCDPKTAMVHEFTCPQNTAFNSQINLCDPRKLKLCKGRNEGVQVEKLIIVQGDEGETSEDNPCEKTGKFPDRTSDKFYYLCYTGNSEILEFVRLACPNDLIFCEKRKVCSSQRFCYD